VCSTEIHWQRLGVFASVSVAYNCFSTEILSYRGVQENAGIENKPRRRRRSREEIAELVRELKSSGLTQRKSSESRGIALSGSQRSLKIERRASELQLMAVQMEAASQCRDHERLLAVPPFSFSITSDSRRDRADRRQR
jgi:hypothetical protein